MLKKHLPVILIFVKYFLPGFRSGGPVRSVSNLVRALEGEYDFRIVCLNRDHGESTTYTDVTHSQWTQLGNVRIYYSTEREAGFTLARRLVREIKPDMIYLNSLFDWEFSMKPSLVAGCVTDTPMLLAPRGELSIGALGLNAGRKNLFLYLARASRYYAQVHWHASSASEDARIREVFAPEACRLFLASNLPEIQQDSLPRTSEKKPRVLKIVLAARISPMKNTLTAIKIAAQLKGEVELDLWGPLENKEYWASCKQQMLLCPSNIKVRHRGEVEHEKLPSILKCYDVMLLPTLGENFGHSIIEALDAGLPVVTSDRTPWRNLELAGVGADLPLEDEAAFIHTLGQYQAMDENEMNATRQACRRYVNEWRILHTNLDDYKKMFNAVIKSGKQH